MLSIGSDGRCKLWLGNSMDAMGVRMRCSYSSSTQTLLLNGKYHFHFEPKTGKLVGQKSEWKTEFSYRYRQPLTKIRNKPLL